jgi:putative oxidoreductase
MKPNSQWGLALLRLIVGIVFVMHGSQKLFTYGIHGVTGSFAGMGIPVSGFTAPLVTFVEFLGGIALILGLFTRWAALLLAINMVGAMYFVHLKNGFYAPGGVEYPLTLMAANVALFFAGPGIAAVDGLIGTRK